MKFDPSRWIVNVLSKNMLAWLIFGLLVISVSGNRTTERDIQRLCLLLGDHDMSVKHPKTPQQEIDNICLNHEPNQVGELDR